MIPGCFSKDVCLLWQRENTRSMEHCQSAASAFVTANDVHVYIYHRGFPSCHCNWHLICLQLLHFLMFLVLCHIFPKVLFQNKWRKKSDVPAVWGTYGPITAEFGSGVWATPANFNGFLVLAALLHGTLVVGVSQTLWHWTEGDTYVWQGGHRVGHWLTFLVFICFKNKMLECLLSTSGAKVDC